MLTLDIQYKCYQKQNSTSWLDARVKKNKNKIYFKKIVLIWQKSSCRCLHEVGVLHQETFKRMRSVGGDTVITIEWTWNFRGKEGWDGEIQKRGEWQDDASW